MPVLFTYPYDPMPSECFVECVVCVSELKDNKIVLSRIQYLSWSLHRSAVWMFINRTYPNCQISRHS